MNAVEKMQQKIDVRIEKSNQSEMKDIAKAMEIEDKTVVLKTIPTDALIEELSRRMLLLEKRDRAIKELFRIHEE